MFNTQRSQWDIRRFVQTLSYFEVVPALNWLQNLIQGKSSDNIKKPDGAKPVGVVLVIGATSDLGKCVVEQLISQGYTVRSVVAEIETAREILGNETELVVADLNDISTFTPLVWGNISAIIYCDEGNPQIEQLQKLVSTAQTYLPIPGSKLLFDFTNPSTELKQTWGAVDDVVMGGVSQSSMQIIEGSGLFAGNVSTANSGGFASVRSRNFDPAFNLSNYAGIQLRVRGDGQRYKFLLRHQSQWDGMAYSYSFDTVANTWVDVQIPFASLTPVFRAKTVNDAPPLPTQAICSCQLMLSKFEYDGQLNPNFTPGGFALQIASIRAYGGVHFPQFIFVSNPHAIAATDIIRHSHIPYTIITPSLLTSDRAINDSPGEYRNGREIIFTQHNHTTGSISRQDVALVCVNALRTSQAHNRTVTVSTSNQSVNPVDQINWEQMFVRLHPD